MLLEALTINLAAALLKTTAKLWFKDTPFTEGAAGALVDTFKKKIEDFETRRATESLFHSLQDEVARRLERLVEREFSSLPEHERTAAALAVADVLNQLPVPESLLAANLDAAQLERAARPTGDRVFSTLSADSRALAALLLRESCNYVVTLTGKLPDFQIAATREILKRHSELLAELGRVLDALAAMRTDPRLDRASEGRDFELQYRRALDRRLDRLELFGVRLVGGGARDYPLTVAYVSLTAAVSGGDAPVRVEDALAGAERAIIRGEAGSGKTTLLRWLAVRAANRDFTGALAPWNARVPIYLALRDYAVEPLPRPERFLDRIATNLLEEMPRGWCQDVLHTRALLLLDGIDELPAARRKEFVTWLQGLLADFERMVVIASSRPAALDAEKPVNLGGLLSTLRFVSSELQPMGLADSGALVAQWHAAVARDVPDEVTRQKLDAYERDVRQVLHDRAPIRHLASTPLLCAMICALNWDRRQRVPDDRMELYRAALEMLLEARDVDRGVGAAYVQGLDRQAKEELLDAIAYWMLRNDLKETDREAVEERVEGALPRLGRVQAHQADVLQELVERSGVLNAPQHGVVGWVHRTFLEFMGARAAVAAGDIRLLADQAKQESWRETIVFAAGHARGKARDQLVRELLKKRWLTSRPIEAQVTAACCLETVGNSLDPDLLADLKNLARRLFPPKDTATALLLAPAAAMEPELLEGHVTAPPATVAACIRTAAVVGGPRMLDVIAGYAEVQGREVEAEIARAWQAFDGCAFVEQVIRRRTSFLGLDPSELDEESLQFLQLLIELGQVPPPYDQAKERLDQFRRGHRLLLTKTVQTEAPSGASDTQTWFGWVTRRTPRGAVEGGTRTAPRLSTGVVHRIAGLRSLEHLSLPELDPEVISALAELTNLKSLAFIVERPPDLQWLPRLTGLTDLSLRGARVTDLTPLAGLTGLTRLSLDNTEVRDLTPLAGLTGLTRLSLDNTEVRDLTPLAGLTGLTELSLASTRVTNLTPLAGLTGLTELSLASTGVADLTPLAGLTALTTLSLVGTTVVSSGTPPSGSFNYKSVTKICGRQVGHAANSSAWPSARSGTGAEVP